MNKIFKSLSIFLLIVCVFSFFSEMALATDSLQPILQVPIPGLDASKLAAATCAAGQPCQINWLAQYISAIYKYGVGIAGILAMVMIMAGGFLWLTSAGSPDRVGKAKEYITSALVGLILALFSYLILATINPELVDLKNISMQGIKTSASDNEEILFDSGSNKSNPSSSSSTLSTNSFDNQGNPKSSQFWSFVATPIAIGGSGRNFGDPRDSGRTHQGVDILFDAPGYEVFVPEGCSSCTVTKGYQAGGAGNYVILDLGKNQKGENIQIAYMHLGNNDKVFNSLKSGSVLRAGDQLGIVGPAGSGNSTGNVLHYEVRINGKPVDPCSTGYLTGCEK